MGELLSVKELKVVFNIDDFQVNAVNDFSFDIKSGEIFAVVGESGSGKSVCALSITRLLENAGAEIVKGSIKLGEVELTELSPNEMSRVRGGEVAYIFQEPMTSLNPLHTVVRQVSERMVSEDNMSEKDAFDKAFELLENVGIRDIKSRLNHYPHQFSGGEKQRVMIAMALACNPKLLVADEPTTALDVTVQRQILDLIYNMGRDRNMAVLLITHDLGVAKKYADRIAVVKKGLVEEIGTKEKLFSSPSSEYTKKLMNPLSKGPFDYTEDTEVIFKVKDLNVTYSSSGKRGSYTVNAVKGASFDLRKGESLGIVGESGSGKSSLARGILRLTKSDGSALYRGTDLISADTKTMRKLRQSVQIVFQDPFGSLNPRMTASMIVAEGLKASGIKDKKIIREKVIEAFKDVKLDTEMYDRYPHEFSGGQRQRIAIARALIMKPEIIFMDEATSSLDRLVQVQIIELLKMLQNKYGLTYIFISHDLGVVQSLCRRVLVMKDGEIIESGSAKQIFSSPENEYTKSLIEAALYI